MEIILTYHYTNINLVLLHSMLSLLLYFECSWKNWYLDLYMISWVCCGFSYCTIGLTEISLELSSSFTYEHNFFLSLPLARLTSVVIFKSGYIIWKSSNCEWSDLWLLHSAYTHGKHLIVSIIIYLYFVGF